EPRLDLGGQRVVGAVHVGELCATERLAVAMRNADPVKHVHEARHLAIGHVGVPVLPGIRAADIFSALLEVREDVDLGIFLDRIAAAGRRPLDLAELLREALQRTKVEMLVGKPQHAVSAKREQNLPPIPLAQRLRQIDPARRRPEHRAGRFNGEHRRLLAYSCGSTTTVPTFPPASTALCAAAVWYSGKRAATERMRPGVA